MASSLCRIIIGLWHTDAGSGGHPPHQAQRRRAASLHRRRPRQARQSLARIAHRRTYAMDMAQSSRRPSTRGLTRSLKLNLTTPWDVKTAYGKPMAAEALSPRSKLAATSTIVHSQRVFGHAKGRGRARIRKRRASKEGATIAKPVSAPQFPGPQSTSRSPCRLPENRGEPTLFGPVDAQLLSATCFGIGGLRIRQILVEHPCIGSASWARTRCAGGFPLPTQPPPVPRALDSRYSRLGRRCRRSPRSICSATRRARNAAAGRGLRGTVCRRRQRRPRRLR